jgi:N-acetylglucosamine kinase-like BadF-type ATPase
MRNPAAMPSLYMGIDGGGSGLRVAIADAELTLYGQAEGPPANPSAVGRERAAAIVQAAMRAALGDLPPRAVAAVGIGLAGAAASHSGDWLREVVGVVLPEARVAPSADYEIALVGALGRQRGLLVLAGTGALAYGVNDLGESALAGGWGYLLGDEGSGYWLGLEGLRAVLRAEDGRGPETMLSAGLLPALGLDAARDLIPWLYRATASRTAQVASLAPRVLDAARQGDACAAAIISAGAGELAQAAQAVMRRLAMSAPQIAFAGGLLRAPNPLSDALCQLLALDRTPQPLYPPVIGAVLLARESS